MASTMRALVKAEAGEGLEMQDVAVPEVGDNDVLVRIRKTGICGTDLHIWNWDEWASATVPVPLVIGHEYAGEIVSVGTDVTRVKPGQRVSGEGHLVGKTSRAVRAGKFHLDPDTKGIGVNIPGAFAEYLRIPAFNIVVLPDAIGDEVGAILDPLGNAVHTALSFDLVGEDVLITGAGPIGIMAAMVARHVGARKIVITDPNQDRLDLAARLCDLTPVNVQREEVADVARRIGLKEGFDVGFEMSGSPAAFETMVDNLIMGGRIAFLGIPARSFSVNWATLIFKAITIKCVYGREMFETWYKMIAMLESGLDVSGVITGVVKANDYAQAFARMRTGNPGKLVLDWT